MAVVYQRRESAFNGRIKTYAIVNVEHIDLAAFLSDAYTIFESKQRTLIENRHLIKTCAIFEAEFKKLTPDAQEIRTKLYISGSLEIMDLETNIGEWFKVFAKDIIDKRIQEFEIGGSGWTLSQILELVIQNNRYDPIRGSSYFQLPSYIKNKNAVINVKNLYDKMCFKWAVLSKMYPAKSHSDRLSNYTPYADKLNFSGIKFPVQIEQISRFEKLNPTISVNVYCYNSETDGRIGPIRLTKEVKRHHIHLLLIQKYISSTSSSSSPTTANNLSESIVIKKNTLLLD